MAFLTPDAVFNRGGVTVKEYLLTKHNQNKIDMPKAPMSPSTILGVTVHNTDRIKIATGTTEPEQYTRATLNGNMGTVRVHYYVNEVEAWQNLPHSLSGWHAADGAGNGNRRTIAIECIMSGDTKDERNAKSADNCARLAASLLHEYGLGIDRLFTHTHWLAVLAGRKGDVDTLNTMRGLKKWCPAYILPYWKDFKALVKVYLDELNAPPATPDEPADEPTAPETPEPEYEVPTRVLRKGMFGKDVKWLQKKLSEAGYLRDNEIDGDFGKITLGALLAYQLENDLEVDGVCGKQTRESLGA